jgi:FkbM family methyltransferase
MKTLETRYGNLEVPDVEHDLIGRFLARYGEWANDEVRFVAAALPTDKPLRVLDIGAFVGTFGIGLSQVTNVVSTTFVEANAEVAPLLIRNAKHNTRGQSTVIEAAITPDGQAMDATYDALNLGSLSFAALDDKARMQLKKPVRFVNLAEVVAQAGEVDLIKMDVEGLEYAILDANRSFLGAEGPAFWLECNNSRQSLALFELLRECGLQVHYFAFPSFAPDNFLKNSEPIFPCAYEAGLWASRGAAPVLPTVLQDHECILRCVHTREELRHALWQTPRWGPSAWQKTSRAELIAEAIHALSGERFENFLIDPHVEVRVAGASLPDVVTQLKSSRLSQAKAEAEARALRALLEDAERRLTHAEGLRQIDADLQILARETARQLEVQKEEAARQLEMQRSETAAAEQRLLQIQRSPYWRISRPLRDFLSRHERLRKGMRRTVSAAYRMLR